MKNFESKVIYISLDIKSIHFYTSRIAPNQVEPDLANRTTSILAKYDFAIFDGLLAIGATLSSPGSRSPYRPALAVKLQISLMTFDLPI